MRGRKTPLVIWIDTSSRPDLEKIDFQRFIDEQRTVLTYWMYDKAVFYLMVEQNEPYFHDFSLPIPV